MDPIRFEAKVRQKAMDTRWGSHEDQHTRDARPWERIEAHFNAHLTGVSGASVDGGQAISVVFSVTTATHVAVAIG